MPQIHGKLVDGEAVICIRVRQRSGASWLVSPDYKAGLDTEAAQLHFGPITLEDEEFVESRRDRVQTGGGAVDVCVYSVELAVIIDGQEPADGDWLPLEAWALPHMPSPRCDVLLGWTFLKRRVFVFDGQNETFTLSW
jgi:hypothetical protein